MNIIVIIFAIYGLSFLVKEATIFDVPRNYLIKHSSFFFNLIDCYFCLSVHSGYVVYLLSNPISSWNLFDLILWSLAGGTTGLVINGIVNKLYESKQL